MAGGDTAATASAARPTDRTTIAASHRSRRPAAAARPGRSRADRPGSGNGCACAPRGRTTAASAAATTRSPRTSSQSCRLIAGLIRMRSTSGRLAARCSSVTCSAVQREVNAALVRPHHTRQLHRLALRRGQRALRRHIQADIDVETELMAEMPARQRPAAWPRDVLDVEIAQSGRTHLLAQGSRCARWSKARPRTNSATGGWSGIPAPRPAAAPRRRCSRRPDRR